MKKLYVIRHAKSSWKDWSLKDYERPLNKRGKRDIPVMGKFLADREITFDACLTSHAKRARLTAEGICDSVGFDKKEIIENRKLYHASEEEIMHFIKNIPNNYGSVAIFGHNPGFTDFVNSLCLTEIDNVPTTGICSICFSVKKWNKIGFGQGALDFFVSPKTI